MISQLLKLIQEFLTIEGLKKNFFEKGKLLLNALIEKNQNDLFEKNMKLTSDELDRRGIDGLYYFNNSILLSLKINNDSINHFQKTQKILNIVIQFYFLT